jgi:chorismate mutase
MKVNSKYFLVDSSVVPEIFSKVLDAKKLIASNLGISVNEAVQRIGISRSAYYKYKDSVFHFYEMSHGKVMTLLCVVEDIPGVLSEILGKVSSAKANVLTIHQNLPINMLADITITFESKDIVIDIQKLLDEISSIRGVKRQEILARE